MDLPRLLIASVVLAASAASAPPAPAQTRAPESTQAPSDLELRFKEGVQELGEGAQKVAAALEAGARDFWAAGKAAFEAGTQTWQARRDARVQASPVPPDRPPAK